jgi:hypothetical protein
VKVKEHFWGRVRVDSCAGQVCGSHRIHMLDCRCLITYVRTRRKHRPEKLTSKLMSLEMGLPCKFCSAGVALLGLWDGGNIPRMGLSGTVGFLGLWGATDYMLWRRHEERR